MEKYNLAIISDSIATLTAQIEAITAGGGNLVFVGETGETGAGRVYTNSKIAVDTTFINTLGVIESTSRLIFNIPTTGLYSINFTVMTDERRDISKVFLGVGKKRFLGSQAMLGYYGNITVPIKAGEGVYIETVGRIELSELNSPPVVLAITQIGQRQPVLATTSPIED